MKSDLLESTVIIPIYNNAYVIRQVVEGFLQQTVPQGCFEMVIIDDCSTDHPEQVIADHIANGIVRFIRNAQNSGPAFSRNRALDAARGELIIFSDGDAVPAENFLEEHLKFHQGHPQEEYAALGNLQAPKDVVMTPLMYLGNVLQNWDSTEMFKEGVNSRTGFCTANFSLKKSLINGMRFNEKIFKEAGFEDTELGLRLAGRGMKILFCKGAVSYHYHFRTPEQYVNKVIHYGVLFARLIKYCDPENKKELQEQYNSLIDWEHLWTAKNIKEIIRRCCVNDATAPLIMAAARFFEKNDEGRSVFFYNKLYKYLFLKGYVKEMSKLKMILRKET